MGGALAAMEALQPLVSTEAPLAFTHPGGLLTLTDLDRMKTQVAAGAHPWIDDWNVLITDSEAQYTYTAAAQANMGANRQRADADAHAAYLNTIRWYISGDTRYANCAVNILNAWSAAVNQVPTGTDAGLFGIPIFDFAIAGEVLRIYSGWDTTHFNTFKNMMTTYLYPSSHNFLATPNLTVWSNWDACNIGAILTIGVLCDDQAKFDEAVTYYETGAGNGSIMNAVYYMHSDTLGQWQESGRDQEHAQLAVGLLASVCQVAWNQGLDLYAYANNRLLAGAEYVAQTNLSKPVPYMPYNGASLYVNQYYISINGIGRLDDRPFWEMIYNHYVVLQGLSAPNVQAMAQLMRPEHGSNDHLGYGTLTFTLSAAASPYPPSPIAPMPTGLTATAGVGRVMLQWNSSGDTAQGYRVQRATTSGGPYTTIASWTANTTPQYTDTTVTNGTTYYYVVAAINQSGTSANSTQASARPAASGALPSGWAQLDIGTVTPAGSASYASVSNGTFIVSSSATSDIAGTADSFTYAYKSVTGDYTLIGRLLINGNNKVGLMMRNTLDAGSMAVTITLGETGGRETKFRTRSSTGGSIAVTAVGNDYTWTPVWYKLQRSGNTFTAYQSLDGVTWFTVGSSTVSMASTYYVGLAVCGSAAATFDNVTRPSTAPADLTVTPGDAQVSMSWMAFSGATSYNVKRTAVSGGPYTTVGSDVTATNFTNTGLTNGTNYYYVVSAVVAGVETPNSLEVSVKPRPNYGYWMFNENSGTIAADSSGGGANGALLTGASWTTGKFGNAISLNGTNGYARFPAGFISTLNDYTIAGWVNLNSVSTWARIFDFGSGTSVYMFLTPKSGSNAIRFAISTSGGSGEQQINGTSIPSTGVWHHFAVTLSGTVGILYVDGVAVGRNNNMTLKPSNLGYTTQNYIGKSQYSDPYLNGSVDDFRIYSRALSPTEVYYLFSPPASVVGRKIFYNNSKFDAASDNNAIATDKEALLPGHTATFANYTSFSRGINGIMIDILGLANPSGLNATDFEFKTGDGGGVWTTVTALASVAVRQGQGANNSDRVTITWADNSIQNQWLQVKVLAGDNTGLAAADVFYFGNAIGESGDNPANAVVDSADEIGSRTHKTGFTAAAIDNPYDYNRDGKVNATDDLIARNNTSAALQLIAAPVGVP